MTEDTIKPLGPTESTGRGFEIITFQDRYSAPCSLQQSSLAEYEIPGTSAVWLGVEGDKSRMHLDRTQVEALIAHLRQWLDNDTFTLPEESEHSKAIRYAQGEEQFLP